MGLPVALQLLRREIFIGGAQRGTRLEARPSPVLLQKYVAGQLACGVDSSLDVGRQKVRSYEGGNCLMAVVHAYVSPRPTARSTMNLWLHVLFAKACIWMLQ
jgi:hypothetical protein